MSIASTIEPRFQSAMMACIASLRRLAGYELEPSIAHRLQELSEQKEFLDSREHEELMALVGFSQKRSIEKLEAQAALQRLGEVLPELV